MKVSSKVKDLEMELIDLLNLFSLSQDQVLFHEENIMSDIVVNTFKFDGEDKIYEYENVLPSGIDELKKKSFRKRFVKKNLYELISKKFNISLPWGSLTGIRPVKLARDLISNGETKDYLVSEFLQKEFFVSEKKAGLVARILRNQKGIIHNDNLVSLYVNIPICPSRCAYCSFISNELKRVENIVDDYVDCLIKELMAVKEIISEKNLIVKSIYIGGGTPSVLNEAQFEKLLNELNFLVNEFTVECGRPDTITDSKLKILKKHGVTRISINPQTFSDKTLKRIGRNHTSLDVLTAYDIALQNGFDVNMDLILGLPGEGKAQMLKNVDTAIELFPHNITLHTLSIKNGSVLKDNNDMKALRDFSKVLQEAQDRLSSAGYKPYYLYRQKNQVGGLENVGYFREDKPCMFNIDSMEEVTSIIAIGANAASKRIFNSENRIERSFNVKFIDDYIRQIDEMIERKRKLFN